LLVRINLLQIKVVSAALEFHQGREEKGEEEDKAASSPKKTFMEIF
jgi:hypothetical protein